VSQLFQGRAARRPKSSPVLLDRQEIIIRWLEDHVVVIAGLHRYTLDASCKGAAAKASQEEDGQWAPRGAREEEEEEWGRRRTGRGGGRKRRAADPAAKTNEGDQEEEEEEDEDEHEMRWREYGGRMGGEEDRGRGRPQRG